MTQHPLDLDRPGRRMADWLCPCLTALLLAACGGGHDDGSGTLAATAGTPPTLTAQPASATVTAPAAATFTVAASGSDPLNFQWQRNGTPIAGANAATYTTPATVAADNGALFTVAVGNGAGSVTSAAATLTVQSTGGTAGGGPVVATDYVLAGLVDLHANGSSSEHHYVLYLVDPSHPETTRIVEDFGADQPIVAYSDASEIDSAAKTSLYRGAAQALYVKDRRLWAIDLIAGLSHVPRQVSSASVCGMKPLGNGFEVPVDSSAREAWVGIKDCSGTKPILTQTFVKSSMTPADAPVTITTASFDGYFATLADRNGAFVGGIAQGDGHLDFYDRNFVKQGAVAGSEGLHLAQLEGGISDLSADQASYLTIDHRLYRLTWTSMSAQMVLASGAADPVSQALSDADAVYFVAGPTLLRKAGEGPAVPIGTLSGPPIAALWMTDDRVIVQQSDGTGNTQSLIVTSIDKTGRTAPIVLAAGNGVALGTTADSVVLRVGEEAHLVKADGSGDRSLGAAMPVYDPLRHGDRSRVAATLTCKATATAASNCSNGTIVETLFDGTTLTLGQVTHDVDYRFAVFGSPTRLDDSSVRALGLPELITFHDAGSAQTDLYLWRHGQADSLVRLTRNVP